MALQKEQKISSSDLRSWQKRPVKAFVHRQMKESGMLPGIQVPPFMQGPWSQVTARKQNRKMWKKPWSQVMAMN